MTYDVIEPFFICLLASMIWAPLVFFAAHKLAGDHGADRRPGDDKIWPAALTIAAAPALFAPIAAVFGWSLRRAPDAAPAPIAQPVFEPLAAAPAFDAAVAAPAIGLAEMFEAAALLYFYGFLLFLLLGLLRMVHFSHRIRYAYDIDEPRLVAGMEAWRHRIGVTRRPNYLYSDTISSVCVYGIFRQSVLMPTDLLERVSLDDAILMGAHEMAHIKRGDTSLFALCAAVKAVFWFNPFMRHIAARANLAAEQAADALVVSHGASRRRYAACFLEGLRFAAHHQRDARLIGQEFAPTFTPFDKKSRRARLDAILSGAAGPFISLRSKIGLAASAAIAGALAFAQAAFAVAPAPVDVLPLSPVAGKVTLEFYGPGARGGKGDGIDIKTQRGAIVRAAGPGKVIDATSRYRGQPAWGKVVVIDHGAGLVTRYSHLDSFIVKKGQIVDTGKTIGYVGSSGAVTVPMLHFEVLQNGLSVDAAPVVAAPPLPAPAPLAASTPLVDLKANIASPAAPGADGAPHNLLGETFEHGLSIDLDKIDNKLRNAFRDLKSRPPVAEDPRLEDLAAALSEELEGIVIEAPKLAGLGDKMTVYGTEYGYALTLKGDTTPALKAKDLEKLREDAIKRARETMQETKEAHARALAEMRRAHAEANAARNAAHAEAEAHAHASARARAETARRQAQTDNAKAASEEARKKAERERKRAERAREKAERARERAEKAREKGEREREKAERERERLERARERQDKAAERARERAEQERERAADAAEHAKERNARNRERAAERIDRAIERAERRANEMIDKIERDWEKRVDGVAGNVIPDDIVAWRNDAMAAANKQYNQEMKRLHKAQKNLDKHFDRESRQL
ncbi:MAG: M23/M56 family metallopeptidase [Pseudomonadota bacterium]